MLVNENNFLLPTVITTERPDVVASSILEGKVALVIDNSPFVIIIPGLFNADLITWRFVSDLIILFKVLGGL